MQFNFIQIGLAFIEGVGLILSPCILPILPIMLAASIDGGKKRPLGIITGFIGSFTLFALLSRQLLTWLHADPEIVRDVALVFLIGFGLIMLSKNLSDKLLGATQGLANFGQNLTARWNGGNGYFSGVAIGALIGLIWAPCAGPIMAAAIVQIIQAKTNIEAILTVIMFAFGAGLPMLLIALLGRQIMGRISFLKTHSYVVRRVLGVVIIGAAFLIYEGADVELLAGSSHQTAAIVSDGRLRKALDKPYSAPEIVGIEGWINSSPLHMSDLRGKVVLVDFWTYSCINCVRTLPFVTAWDEKYRDKGLVIIGIHSPEFEFEKKLDNVKMAVQKFGIHYPVALDSNLATWSSFQNRYWPAHYLINKEGQVVYTHFGEGDYDVTENNIRVLLGLDTEVSQKGVPPQHAGPGLTQETYLGYERAKNFTSPEDIVKDTSTHYDFPKKLLKNQWALEGNWIVGSQNITADGDKTALKLHFVAKKVFLVLGTEDGKPLTVHLKLNNASLGTSTGGDVKNDTLTVSQERLYELIDQGTVKNGVLEIDADAPGLQAYAFTFGG